jgi:hypothetical protein
MRSLRLLPLFALALALASCGPSTADIQSTIDASVAGTVTTIAQSTAQAATATAAEVCGAAALTRYADTLEPQIQTFEMQAGLVSNTARISMGPALQALLDLQTETRQMDVPPCLAEYHAQVVSMMGLYRAGYENFSAQGDEAMTTAALRMGGESLAHIKATLPTLRQGTVPPVATPAR